MSAPSLSRHVFKTSRLAEFSSKKELVNQTGHAVEDWPVVVLKELLDNGLDAGEEAGIAPAIEIVVSRAGTSPTMRRESRLTPLRISSTLLPHLIRRGLCVSNARGAGQRRGNQNITLKAFFQSDRLFGEIISDEEFEKMTGINYATRSPVPVAAFSAIQKGISS
jgi:DNA topoisomerase VI subunit B